MSNHTQKTEAYEAGEKEGIWLVQSERCRISEDVTAYKKSLNPYDKDDEPFAFRDWVAGFSDGYESGRCTGFDDDDQD